MFYPNIQKKAGHAVSVPALSGGVNMLDPLNLIDDNQLTDVKNMWYKNGVLQTRPAINSTKVVLGDLEISSDTDVEMYTKIIPQYTGNLNDGTPRKYIATVSKVKKTDGSGILKVVFIDVALKFSTTITTFDDFNNMPTSEVFYFAKSIIKGGSGLYMLGTLSDGTVHLYEAEAEANGSPKEFVKLSSNQLYQPTVYINGKGTKYSSLSASSQGEYAPASFFEGYNAISDAWAKFCYTSDGESVNFVLPVDLNTDALTEIYVEYTDIEDSKKYTYGPLTVPEGYGVEGSGYSWDGDIRCNKTSTKKYVSINRIFNNIQFWTDGASSATKIPSALNTSGNNIVVKLKFKNTNSILRGMQFGTWFGGSSDGINGGTRLFVSGSSENKSLLCWSDVENPTYFSENNYACVGEESQKITSLQKQDNMLVIFKENEIFYTTYTKGDSVSKEQIISGSVIDIAAQAAIFPMVAIQSEVGCDLPNTIQICGNRLVWACKDKHVYMLKSANQYSTANVSRISSMCDRALANLTNAELSNATAGLKDGHYLLKIGEKIFALNYDHYYFNNLPAYSDKKSAQRKLQWWIWEIPKDTSSVICSFLSTNDKCSIIYGHKYNTDDSNIKIEYRLVQFNDTLVVDKNPVFETTDGITSVVFEDIPITSMLQTKMFDFGYMDRFKKIEQLYIGFGEKAGETQINYITDSGTLDGGVVEINSESDDYSVEYIKTKRFLPCVNRALRFGVKLECKGRVAVDGIMIKYKTMGVTR